MVLFVLAGAVGVIGVVVAYRRQRGLEQGRFLERLAEASRLLGDENPTVQAAGVYTLAGLADAEEHHRRQQCVDVLCAYIRLPYAPAPEGHEPKELMSIKRTQNIGDPADPIEEEQSLFRPHDRHTRQTIIRVITQHLRAGARVSWSDLDFDFTGAVFDYGDFTEASFKGFFNFNDARFAGGTVTFGGALFLNGYVDFEGAEFTGGIVKFFGTEFDGASVYFRDAQFSGATVYFDNAYFLRNDVNFNGAKFTGGEVHFQGVTFSGSDVTFEGAEFAGGTTHFEYSTFSGGLVDFRGAKFAGGTVRFNPSLAWTNPPQGPWRDGDESPLGVQPRQWPPELKDFNGSVT